MTEEAKNNQDVNYIDIDEFIPVERTIKINEKIYKVNGGISTENAMKLASRTREDRSPRAIESLIEEISSFFITPIEKKELLKLDVNTQLPVLINFLCSNKKKGNTEDSKKKEQ